MLSAHHWRKNAEFDESFERFCNECARIEDIHAVLADSGSKTGVDGLGKRRSWRRLQEALEDVLRQCASDPIGDTSMVAALSPMLPPVGVPSSSADGGFELDKNRVEHSREVATSSTLTTSSEAPATKQLKGYFASGIIFKDEVAGAVDTSPSDEVEEGSVDVTLTTDRGDSSSLRVCSSLFWRKPPAAISAGLTTCSMGRRSPSTLMFVKVGKSRSEEFRYNPEPFASPFTFTFDVFVKGERESRTSFLQRASLPLLLRAIAEITALASKTDFQILDGSHVSVELVVDKVPLRLPERVPQLPPIQFARSYAPAPLVARHTSPMRGQRKRHSNEHAAGSVLGDGSRARLSGAMTSKVSTNTAFVLSHKRRGRQRSQTPTMKLIFDKSDDEPT